MSLKYHLGNVKALPRSYVTLERNGARIEFVNNFLFLFTVSRPVISFVDYRLAPPPCPLPIIINIDKPTTLEVTSP